MSKNTVSGNSHSFRKYAVTFLAFAAAVGFVVALAFLITGGTSENWVTGNNGTARETMFPFVFTSDSSLYIMDENYTVLPIDDNVTAPVHDTQFDMVYYTRYGELYEYTISSNTRKKLCTGVYEYFLFTERKSVIFISEAGAVSVYKYQGSSVSLLFDPESEENTGRALVSYKKGSSHFAYLISDADDQSSGTLYVTDVNGLSVSQYENVSTKDSFSFWDGDDAISYCSDGKLIVSVIGGKDASFESGTPVSSQARAYAVDPCTVVEDYDGSFDYKYVIHDINDENGTCALSYVNITKIGISTKVISENVQKVLGYDEDSGIVVFTEQTGENVSVMYSQNGGIAGVLAEVPDTFSLYFDANTDTLFYKTEENVLYIVDVNNYRHTASIVAYDAEHVYPYVNQDMTVIHYIDSDSKSVLISDNRVDTYSVTEERLYGNVTNKYLVCRQNNSSFTLDFVKDDEITRLSENCSRSIFFDKNLDYILYIENGEIKILHDSVTVTAGTFTKGIESVNIISTK